MSTVYQQKNASKRGGQKQHPQRCLALPGGRRLRGDFDQSRVEEDPMAEDTASYSQAGGSGGGAAFCSHPSLPIPLLRSDSWLFRAASAHRHHPQISQTRCLTGGS